MTPVQALALLALTAMTTASAAVLPPPHRGSSPDQRAASAWMSSQEDNSSRFDSQRWDDLQNVSKLNPEEKASMLFVMGDLPLDRCHLSTCIITDLGERLQGGDEVAGGITSDPLGPGRK